MRDAGARRLRLAQDNGRAGWVYSRRSVAGRGTRTRCWERHDDDHAADATVRTLVHVELGYAQPERHDRFWRPRWWHRRLAEHGARVREFGGLGPIGDDPVMADAYEARGQDVQQKAADEFGRIEREYFAGVAQGEGADAAPGRTYARRDESGTRTTARHPRADRASPLRDRYARHGGHAAPRQGFGLCPTRDTDPGWKGL